VDSVVGFLRASRDFPFRCDSCWCGEPANCVIGTKASFSILLHSKTVLGLWEADPQAFGPIGTAIGTVDYSTSCHNPELSCANALPINFLAISLLAVG
jgi:hypothetical protein